MDVLDQAVPSHSPYLVFRQHQDERITYKTRRRKPCSKSHKHITSHSRSDSSPRSRHSPAIPRRLLFHQPMAAAQRCTSTSAATSTRSQQTTTAHTYTANRCTSSLQYKCIRQQHPHARELWVPPLPYRRPSRPTTHPRRKREASRLDPLIPWTLQHTFHRRAERHSASRAGPGRHRDQARWNPIPA